jgi:hypothetical protein
MTRKPQAAAYDQYTARVVGRATDLHHYQRRLADVEEAL